MPYVVRDLLKMGQQYITHFDLRLMKQSGSDYSKNDLVIAIYYKEILKSLFQSWFDICKNQERNKYQYL